MSFIPQGCLNRSSQQALEEHDLEGQWVEEVPGHQRAETEAPWGARDSGRDGVTLGCQARTVAEEPFWGAWQE